MSSQLLAGRAGGLAGFHLLRFRLDFTWISIGFVLISVGFGLASAWISNFRLLLL